MGQLITIQDKLADIEEQGKRLRRRRDKLAADRDFLIDTLLYRPTRDMKSQNALIQEWNEEIDRCDRSIEFLRGEYVKYRELLNKQMYNNSKTKKNGRLK